MKKVIFISFKTVLTTICLVSILVGGSIVISHRNFESTEHVNLDIGHEEFSYFEPGKPPEGSLEELYQDLFVSFLQPEIKKAVNNYYGAPYMVAPCLVKILSVERPSGYRTFEFVLKLEVKPYTGPHNSIGVDHITIRVSSGPKVIVEKFEHIKSL
jgi:hypothetical protein